MADTVITPANVLSEDGSSRENGTAGVAVIQGQTVYKDAADAGKFKLADANSVTLAVRACVGFALNSAAAGQPLTIHKAGGLAIGGTLVIGETYYLSSTPGGVKPGFDLAIGDFPIVLGTARTTGILDVNIQQGAAARAA